MKPSPKDNDPCPCSSGRPYTICHRPIVMAPKGRAIAIGQKLYAQDWAINAQSYKSQNLYALLATQLAHLGDVQRVLDVGCGLAHGIEALRDVTDPSRRFILGIDENPSCIAIAAERLGLAIDPSLHSRLDHRFSRLTEMYTPEPKSSPLLIEEDIALANVDLMLPDPAFETWVDAAQRFDAITLWFSGVHKARYQSKIWKSEDIKNDAEHRETLTEKVLDLAERCLRPGGFVQFATRHSGPDLEALRVKHHAVMTDALAAWGLTMISTECFSYKEEAPGAIAVKSLDFDSSDLPHGVFATVASR